MQWSKIPKGIVGPYSGLSGGYALTGTNSVLFTEHNSIGSDGGNFCKQPNRENYFRNKHCIIVQSEYSTYFL